MSDFHSDFWHSSWPASPSSASLACLPCCCGSAAPGQGDGQRQHHRPRLGRRPARNEQPAAALVGVPVHHHRGFRSSTWCCTRAWAARGSWAGPQPASTRPSRKKAEPRWRRCTPSSSGMPPSNWPRTPQAMAIGERLFMNNCASATAPTPAAARASRTSPTTTGSGAATHEAIKTSITAGPHGRDAADGAAVGTAEDVRNVAHYVLSLSGSPHDSCRRNWAKPSSRPAPPATAPTARATRLGAPNLTDNIWLHGWGEQAITASSTKGKQRDAGTEPAADRGADPRAGAYVWGMSKPPQPWPQQVMPTPSR
jgi:hypothetical protein